MDHPNPLDDIARFLRRLQWAAVGLFVCWLLWLLAPILTLDLTAMRGLRTILRRVRDRILSEVSENR